MRKIVSRKEEERKKKKRQSYLVIFLALILFFSLFGVMINSFGEDSSKNLNKINYGGYDFFNSNGYWILNQGETQFAFKYNPNEVKEINTPNIEGFEKYYNKPLYIYSEDVVASQEIYHNLGNFALRIQKACPQEDILNKTFECNSEYPIKNCKDNFIIILNGEEKIEQKENCVIISSQENITKTTDNFLFKTLGII